MHISDILRLQHHWTEYWMECTAMYWRHKLQENFWEHTSQYTMDYLPQKTVDLISITYQNFENSVLKLLFSKVRGSLRLHLIPNTLQQTPGLYNETDNTEHTAWYTMDPFLSTRRPWLCRRDYITLLSTTENHLQEKAQFRTENYMTLGYRSIRKKTKVMGMNLR